MLSLFSWAPFKKNLTALFFLIAIIGIVFSPSLSNGFVNWDDDVHLLSNPYIEDLDAQHIKEIFTTTVNKTYIPLTLLSFAVERKFFGLNPFVYHLDNMLLHMAICCLVMLLARRLGLGLPGAVVAALIFGLHPMHVESVVWVTERKDVLYAVFYLGALYTYTFYIQSEIDAQQKKRLYALVLVLCLLSVLAKPMAVSLILVFFLFDWFFGRGFSKAVVLEKIPFLFIIYPAVWLGSVVMGTGLPALSFPESIVRWLWFLTFYLRKFFFPDFFVLHYAIPHPASGLNADYAWAGAAVLGIGASLWILRKYRLYVFAVLFYLATVFVTFPQDLVADRYMYLPSLGFCIWLGVGAGWLLEHSSCKIRMTGFLITALLIVGLGWKTVLQAKVWQDGVALWGHQLLYQAQAKPVLTYGNLGAAYRDTVGYHEAILKFYKYMQYNSLYENNQFLSKDDTRDIDQSIFYLKKAIEINPKTANPYYDLGCIYFDLHQFDLAKENANRAIFYRSSHFDAYFLLGKVNQALDLDHEAVLAFEKAVEVYPEHQRMLKAVMDYFDTMENNKGITPYQEARIRLLARFGG